MNKSEGVWGQAGPRLVDTSEGFGGRKSYEILVPTKANSNLARDHAYGLTRCNTECQSLTNPLWLTAPEMQYRVRAKPHSDLDFNLINGTKSTIRA